MKLAIAQLNYHTGNFEKNKNLIIQSIQKARNSRCDLIVFSELCITGYPPLALLDRYDFIEKCEKTIHEIADHCKNITAIIGAPTINTGSNGKKLYNSALAVSEGKIVFKTHKAILPSHDTFDEYKYFEPGKKFEIFNLKGKKIAVTICEDLWDEEQFDNDFDKQRLYTVSPMDEYAPQKPDIIINISASPFYHDKIETGINLLCKKAEKHHIPVINVNQTGANTELIFDGASKVIDHNGIIIKELPYFKEDMEIIDTDECHRRHNNNYQAKETVSLIHDALIMGIKDYFSKNSISKCIIGLSGGIDSALVTYLATKALGPENTRVLLMPSIYSSSHSVTDSVLLAENLGIQYDTVSIEKPCAAFEEILKPLFKGRKADLTEENIQARSRAIILMAVSNKFGCMLLNTSNKSEAAVGYGTLYGDMAGGLSVIGDVYKTDVYRISKYINREKEIIPHNIITKPPSAELHFGQLDSDSLPEYDILDNILRQYIDLQRPADQITGKGINAATVARVIKMTNFNEYKRFQTPPVLKISSKSFGKGRNLPLAAVL